MNLLALLGAALAPVFVPAPMPVIDVGQNITIEERGDTIVITHADYGVHLSQSFTITTNWVDDPVNSTLQLGIIYSNIIARVSYEGKTNELTMASKLVGLAGTKVKEYTTFTFKQSDMTNRPGTFYLPELQPVDRGNLR